MSDSNNFFEIEAKIPDFLKYELDEEQLDAVLNSDGRTIIIAGPGSGKTRVITYKIAYLLYKGYSPKDILLVTFTRAASKQMINRVKGVTNADLSQLTAGTFHHVCNLILRRYSKLIDYDNNFTILDSEDSKDLMRIIRNEYTSEIGVQKGNFPKENVILKVISYASNTLKSIRESILEIASYLIEFERDIETIWMRYAEMKKQINAMDYDDLIINTLMLFKLNKEVLQKISSKFKYILVDEFQDTNKIQLEFVEALASQNGNLIVVGDDSQSIYSFRGARFENIKDFIELPKTKLFKIQTNYRSTPEIVNFVNEMIPLNSVKKHLKTKRKEYIKPHVIETHDDIEQTEAVKKIIEMKCDEGINFDEIAILYRSHALSMTLQQLLDREKIPYKLLSGKRFIEMAHIKDILAFLKIVQNPYDKISWVRILKLFPGVGVKTAVKIYDEIIKMLMEGNKIQEFISKTSLKKYKQALKTIQKLYESYEKNPAEILTQLHKDFYEEYLNLSFENARSRNMDIERFLDIASRYENLTSFLEDMILSENIEMKSAERDEKKEEITLTTIHGAKGLEWKVVIIVSVNPGDFPNGMAIKEKKLDEEERLFYVAITRAKDELYILKQLTGTTNPYMQNSFVFVKKENDFIAKIPEKVVIKQRTKISF